MKLLGVRDISHKKQTRNNNCVSTCLSMVLGIEESEIREELERDFFEEPFSYEAAIRFLTRKSIYCEIQQGAFSVGLYDEEVYLISCASSICPKMAHMVVGIVINNTIRILDPADDLENEKIYSSNDFADGNIPCFSYIRLIDCRI